MQPNAYARPGDPAASPQEDLQRQQSRPSRPAAEAGVERLGGNRNFEAVMRIPVTVQVILGSATMPVANLMKLGRGAIVPLDHRIGEPVDVVVNGRLIARGEVVVLEEDNSRLGISLTEIVGPNAAGLNE